MISKKLLQGLAAAAVLSASTAGAAQFGANLSIVSGDAETDDLGFSNSKGDFDAKQFGFVLNTGNMQRLFNYRLNVNLVDGEVDSPVGEIETSGVAFNNTFGFAVYRAPQAKVWLGPSVDLSIIETKNAFLGSNDAVGLEFGPTVGGDFSLQPNLMLSVEAGLRFGGFTADGQQNTSVQFETDTFILRGSILFGAH